MRWMISQDWDGPTREHACEQGTAGTFQPLFNLYRHAPIPKHGSHKVVWSEAWRWG